MKSKLIFHPSVYKSLMIEKILKDHKKKNRVRLSTMAKDIGIAANTLRNKRNSGDWSLVEFSAIARMTKMSNEDLIQIVRGYAEQ